MELCSYHTNSAPHEVCETQAEFKVACSPTDLIICAIRVVYAVPNAASQLI